MFRSILVTAIAGIAFAISAGASPSPAGVWRTISDVDGKPRGLVQLSLANGVLTGTAVGTLVPGEDPNRVCERCTGARKNKPVMGMQILWGLKQDPKNPLKFTGGQVLDPDTGGVYQAQVTLSPDGQKIILRGFVGISAIGRSQNWVRSPN
jgi:uncharacterized protein (DUF2147 family)